MKIDKAGFGIIRNTVIITITITVLSFFFLPTWATYTLGSLLAILLFLVICFFRLPQRETLKDADSIYSPADGTVVVCEKVYEDEYLKRECMQISVFMSVANVHANWYPMDGDIEYFKHHNGNFMVAWHPKSSTENERTTIVMRDSNRQILIRQIAGLVARRIVCYAKDIKDVKQNDRMGFIKFGSRLDLFLPLDVDIKVRLNDKVVGSQTVLAEFADKR